MALQTAANGRLAAPRSLLDRYLREAAEAMAEQRKELGKRIAQARSEKRWKQKELAAAVHVEPTTVSRWETGRHAPDIDVLEEIARVTDKPLSFFLDGAAPAGDDAGVPRDLVDRLDRQHDEVIRRLDQVQEQLRTIASTRAGASR
jgi:transcriptional regulator with XRE-family HTH domain